jgi:hypothetical protein
VLGNAVQQFRGRGLRIVLLGRGFFGAASQENRKEEKGEVDELLVHCSTRIHWKQVMRKMRSCCPEAVMLLGQEYQIYGISPGLRKNLLAICAP